MIKVFCVVYMKYQYFYYTSNKYHFEFDDFSNNNRDQSTPILFAILKSCLSS